MHEPDPRVPLDSRATSPPDPVLLRLTEELAACLLPPLLERLERLREALEADPVAARDASSEGTRGHATDGERDRRLATLEAGRGTTQRLGQVLGLVSVGLGADLLRARRDADLLRTIVALVSEGLERQRGVRVRPGADGLPSLDPAGTSGWALALGLGSLFLRAGARRRRGASLRWGPVRATDGSWRIDLSRDFEGALWTRSEETALEGAVGGLRLSRGRGGTATVHLPARHLRAEVQGRERRP